MIAGFSGPMFSGKSTALINQLRRAEIAGKRVVCFKPNIDTRYHESAVVTHEQLSIPALTVPPTGLGLQIIAANSRAVQVVGIDEIQFFPLGVVELVLDLRATGKHVFWAGLDMDYLGSPFGPVPSLMAIGGVTKVHAVCVRCGDMQATHTFKTDRSDPTVVKVAGKELYEARCFRCWSKSA